MQVKGIVISVLLFILSASALLTVNLYPAVDWVTAPATTIFVGLPLLLLHLLLLLLFLRFPQWRGANWVVQSILTVLFITWMVYYIRMH